MKSHSVHTSEKWLGKSLIASIVFHLLTVSVSLLLFKEIVPVFKEKSILSVEVVTAVLNDHALTESSSNDNATGSGNIIAPPERHSSLSGALNTPLLPDAEPSVYYPESQNISAYPSSGYSSGQSTGTGVGNSAGYGSSNGNAISAAGLPFTPKQILEVMPQKTEKRVEGSISLSLLIGPDGNVRKHKVISNTTGNAECLKSVIEAAYKSRWEKVSIKGNPVEYWTDKSYIFN